MSGPFVERAILMALLAVVAWPAVGPTFSRAFWHAFPDAARRLAALLGAYAAGVVLVAIAAPTWMLRGLAGAGVAVLLAVEWHSSVARGRAHRWPPGSLRPLPLGSWFDREFFFDAHRRFGSPFKASQFVRPMACVVGIAEGLDFFKAHEASLASAPLPFQRFVPGGILRYMPPAIHDSTKEFFRRSFQRDVYAAQEPLMREAIRAELARAAEASAASAGQGVPPRRHIQRAVFAIWARLFFRIAPGTAEMARLQALFKVIDIRNPQGAPDAAIHAAVAEITAMLRAQLAAAPPPGAAAPESFLDALAAHHPAAIDDRTVIGNLIYTMHTTWSDVSGLLQWLMRMLTEHPEWVPRLRDAPPTDAATDTGTALPARIVMETLRLEQSEFLYRVVTRDIAHKGFMIPRGWLVRVCVHESHRDPAVFADPHRFDPDRFLRRTHPRREYSPFGAGMRHACLGEGLTMTVGRIFVDELARRCDWQTVADGPYEYGPWRHWRPSSRWRVLVTPIP
jgi:cytochrome P450